MSSLMGYTSFSKELIDESEKDATPFLKAALEGGGGGGGGRVLVAFGGGSS